MTLTRRTFLGTTAVGLIVAPAFAETAYQPGLVDTALAEGKTVFLDFKASWCSTCAAQERVINALKAENPLYEQAILFVAVDWDQYRGAELTKRLNIPRRSTLVVLKGETELGRIVAGTSRTAIKDLMDIALGAATA